jgi:hypothetical protein
MDIKKAVPKDGWFVNNIFLVYTSAKATLSSR